MSKITPGYNIILFCTLVIFNAIQSIFEYSETPSTVLDRFFEYNALIGYVSMFVAFVISFAICVWILHTFWERLISNMFHVRSLTLNETISILLVIAIITT